MFFKVCYEDMFTNEKHEDYRESLVVAGTATVGQIQVALRKYPDRAIYVQKCLYYLFRMTPVFKDARPDIIKLVLLGTLTNIRYLLGHECFIS